MGSYLDGRLVYDGLVVKRRDGYVPLSDAGLGGMGRVEIQPSLTVRAVLPLAPVIQGVRKFVTFLTPPFSLASVDVWQNPSMC